MLVNAISLNDTLGYNIALEHKPLIREIRTVYAYNPDSCTHLCEITPSYELVYLYTYVVPQDDVDSEQSDELDNAYCYEATEDTYMHCSRVKALDNRAAKSCGEFDDMDAAVEHLRGNTPF